MTSLIIDEVVNLTLSIRSLLVRNALITLSEVFQTSKNIFNSKYEEIFKVLIKKVFDKNEFISKDGMTTLEQ